MCVQSAVEQHICSNVFLILRLSKYLHIVVHGRADCTVKGRLGLYLLSSYFLHCESFFSARKERLGMSTRKVKEGDICLMMSYPLLAFLYKHFYWKFLRHHYPFSLFQLTICGCIFLFIWDCLLLYLVCFDGIRQSSVLTQKLAVFISHDCSCYFAKHRHWGKYISIFLHCALELCVCDLGRISESPLQKE